MRPAGRQLDNAGVGSSVTVSVHLHSERKMAQAISIKVSRRTVHGRPLAGIDSKVKRSKNKVIVLSSAN